MNKVYLPHSNVVATPEQLANAANSITINKPFKPEDFMGDNSRISGDGHCYCNGNGEFELLPVYDEMVKTGGKRYMICRKCGATSHL